MFHSHLPRLENHGFITWDRDAGTLERGPNWAEIAPLVRLLNDHQDELPEGWL